MTRKLMLLAGLLLAVSTRAGDLTVDNLTVEADAFFNGVALVSAPNGDISMGEFTNILYITGGTITETNGYRIHTFTGNGAFQVFGCSLTCSVLVVAGGGAGAGRFHSGGGGAGGVVYATNYSVTGTLAVTVGAGGIGPSDYPNVAPNGSNSSFGTLVAIGGGGGGNGGGSGGDQNGHDGGSGGGGNAAPQGGLGGASIQTNPAGATGYGYAGGVGSTNDTNGGGAGGGGGAGSIGSNGVSGVGAGNGGSGRAFDLSGSNTYYAGGGGGASYNSTPGVGGFGGGGNGSGNSQVPYNATDGAPNTGSGGGGAERAGTWKGGNGGSGIVIIRYVPPW